MQFHKIPVINDKKCCMLYLYIILKSDYKTRTAKIKISDIGNDDTLKLSSQNIRTCLKKLTALNLIKTKGTNKYTEVYFEEFDTRKKAVNKKEEEKEKNRKW